MTREGWRKFGSHVAATPDRILDRIARLPSTNFRISVTLACMVWTTGRYLTSTTGWEPSLEWLGFLATMSGLDLAAFGVKRRTEWSGKPPAEEPNADRTDAPRTDA